MGSLLVYVFVFVISIFAVYRFENKTSEYNLIYYSKKEFYYNFLLISIVPIILSGERYNVGTDFQSYISIYKDIQNKNIIELVRLSRFLEPLYIFINKSVSLFFASNFKGIFYLIAIIIFFCLFSGVLNYRKNYVFSISLSYLIFYCAFFPMTLNIQRQMIAVFIVFIAYKYLLSEEPLKYIALIFLAAGFHNTSLIMLPLFLFGLLNSKIKNISYFFISITPLFILLLFPLVQNIELLGKYLEKYSIDSYQGVSIFRIGEMIIFLLPLLINNKLILARYPKIINLMPVILWSFPLITIGGFEPWANRLIYYITVLQILLHPLVVSVQPTKEKKKAWLYIFVVYYISYFLLKFMIVGNEGIFPYITYN